MPNVDDGAYTAEEAMELLRMEVHQGVSEICLTPHFRVDLFCTPDEKIQSEYRKLYKLAKEAELPLQLYLSREYYYDAEFCKRLEKGAVIPIGAYNTLLLEFDYNASAATLLEAAARVSAAGYNPMYAHVERYRAIQKDAALAQKLVQAGVLLQVNADALLGDDGRQYKRTAWSLLENGCVNMVVSDAHNMKQRAPHLRRCATLLEQEIGKENAEILLHHNPLAVLR